MATAEAALHELLTTRPSMHVLNDEPQAWELDDDVMRWLAEHVQPGWNTLETGCGLSSVLFAIKSATHTIIGPFDLEHNFVRTWCAERGISTQHVRSLIACSQDVLPSLESGPLDLVLIDGSHALPTPFIDWYYSSLRLRVGGFVVIDDMHIRSCSLLREFLLKEEGRWRLCDDVGRAVVFEKLADQLIPFTDWTGQPWNTENPSFRSALVGLRTTIRPRNRLRHLARAISPRVRRSEHAGGKPGRSG